jgi:hypothetical protein
MRQLSLMLVIIATSLAAYVWAACPNPDHPTCPQGQIIYHHGWSTNWPCCDMTQVCPQNNQKNARFFRRQGLYSYYDGGQEIQYCVQGPYDDWPIELDECCGDPVSGVGPWQPQ